MLRWALIFVMLIVGSIGTTTPSQGSEPKPEISNTKKIGGIMGDPSRKRGVDLGFDAGPRAGREDMAQNKKLDPRARPEYQKPDQLYRYEYGSRAAFISGYRAGFLKGYRSAVGKVEMARRGIKPEAIAPDVPSSQVANIDAGRVSRSTKPVNPADDAL